MRPLSYTLRTFRQGNESDVKNTYNHDGVSAARIETPERHFLLRWLLGDKLAYEFNTGIRIRFGRDTMSLTKQDNRKQLAKFDWSYGLVVPCNREFLNETEKVLAGAKPKLFGYVKPKKNHHDIFEIYDENSFFLRKSEVLLILRIMGDYLDEIEENRAG